MCVASSTKLRLVSGTPHPPPPPPTLPSLLHLGRRSGFDIEGASRPVVVPVPQTSVAGTLNLGEELFPDSRRQMRERERETERGETDCRAESQGRKANIKLSDVPGRLVAFTSSLKREKPTRHFFYSSHPDLVGSVKEPCSLPTAATENKSACREIYLDKPPS